MRISSIVIDVMYAELNINSPPALDPNDRDDLDDLNDLNDLDDLDDLDDPDDP